MDGVSSRSCLLCKRIHVARHLPLAEPRARRLDPDRVDIFRSDGRAGAAFRKKSGKVPGDSSVIFTPSNVILFGVIALLGVGFYGLLITRNLIKVVMVLQILIKGVVLALVLAGTVGGNPGLGQSTAATVIV